MLIYILFQEGKEMELKFMVEKMKQFFEAKKIAVIGASRNKEKIGRVIFDNLIRNHSLNVFPVNPGAEEISGIKSYTSVLDVPFIVDMAIIAIPAQFVPEVLEQCGRKGIRKAVIISAGFSEAGNVDLSEKIKEIAERYKIEIIGPNVLGVINSYKGINASFFKEMPEKGKVGFISQSGAVGTSLLDKCLEEHLGISAFVSLGNMIQQDFISALEYFAQDLYTEIIVLYIESLNSETGRDFIDLCKKISRKKRIIAIKAGKTKEGIKAAQTHTASLSSDSAIYSGAFKQAGIIEVDSLEEMFLLAKILSKFNKIGKKAGIITNAGGLGVLTVDALVKAGFDIAEIPEKVLLELNVFLPKNYSRTNPLDILGDALAERYDRTLKILLRNKIFDFFVVIVSPQEMTQPVETAEILSKISTPLFACFIGGGSFEKARKLMRQKGVVNFDDVSELMVLEKAV